ncbi:unnamed protein product [Pleuronectes platessa]|uniref:Uncharacterized protein n=1 Tax=Pleuronectes platessa TaxID=8262 RepID=A0A9N7YZI2_PLEPL|nr:unnamed protein product [Pleuronectes platessa]
MSVGGRGTSGWILLLSVTRVPPHVPEDSPVPRLPSPDPASVIPHLRGLYEQLYLEPRGQTAPVRVSIPSHAQHLPLAVNPPPPSPSPFPHVGMLRCPTQFLSGPLMPTVPGGLLGRVRKQ